MAQHKQLIVMGHWQGFTHFLAFATILSLLLCAAATSQDQKAPQSTFDLHAIKPPEHPITEQELRTFFEVTHFLSGRRQRIHEQLQALRKQLPEWYPQSVWDEIANSVEDMDVIAVALPVYQKYISEDDEKFLNRFLATPHGQKVAQAVMAEKAQQGQRANADSEAANYQAIAELVRNQGAEVQHTLSGMSPAELREVKSFTAQWKQLQPVLWQMQGEVSQAIAAKQVERARTIKAKHRAELIEAKRSYDASHTSANSQTPQ